jgi:hypothetical protein
VKRKLTRLLPQRGHVMCSRKPASGMLRSRVQTRVPKIQLGLMMAFSRRPRVIEAAAKASRMNAPAGRKGIAKCQPA